MLGKRLEDLTEEDLIALGRNAIPEGPRIEFKREVDLKGDRAREAAKDVAAMANSIGGRLFLGISEKDGDEGPVADRVVPFTDPGFQDRLEDVLNSRIDPPAQFYMRQVTVSGGFVLVVDVVSSAGLNLHMVSDRFYRRGQRKTAVMTEAEVRECYIQIGERRATLEARVAALSATEMGRITGAADSTIVIPLHGHAGLVDPRRHPALGTELLEAGLKNLLVYSSHLRRLALMHDGYRAPGFKSTTPYIAILKSGLVHTSFGGAFREGESLDGGPRLKSLDAAIRIIETLALAQQVLDQAHYRGSVQIRYAVRTPSRTWQVDRSAVDESNIEQGTYASLVPSVDLSEHQGSWGWIVKELLDPIFHAAGMVESPFFTSTGAVRPNFSTTFDHYVSLGLLR